MSTLRTIAIAATLSLCPLAAQAGYLQSRTDWNEQTAGDKATYAMGVVDAMLIQYIFDAPSEIAFKRGVESCLSTLRLPARDLTKMVDEAYAADAAKWTTAPNIILLQQLNKVCGTQINTERATLKLPPRK